MRGESPSSTPMARQDSAAPFPAQHPDSRAPAPPVRPGFIQPRLIRILEHTICTRAHSGLTLLTEMSTRNILVKGEVSELAAYSIRALDGTWPH